MRPPPPTTGVPAVVEPAPAAPADGPLLPEIGLGPDDAWILGRVADRLEPPPDEAPSDWGARHVVLTADQTPAPGPFDPDYLPFQRDAMDAAWREPDRLGVVHVKCAQVGMTLCELVVVARDQMTEPGPTLVLDPDELKAKEYRDERFVPIVKSSGALARATEEAGSDKRVVGYGVHFPGGKITFAWASSETRLVGTPFRRIVVDDAQLCFEKYAALGVGDLFTTCLTRTEAYRGLRRIGVNGHPRTTEDGLWLLYAGESDQRTWTIDCPGCAGPVALRWRNVHHRERGDDGRPRPETAELRCPHCARAISDGERARETWPARLGGSGRYQSELEPAEARRRRFIGLHTTRLADHRVSVLELARQVAACGDDEAKLLDVMNKVIGEPREPRGAVALTDAHLAELLDPGQEDAPVKTVPGDVEFLTCGVDVQKGPTGEAGPPGLYAVVVAWGRGGLAHIVEARVGVGFDWLFGRLLAPLHVRTADGRVLPVRWCGIDAAYRTTAVLEACRGAVYAACPGPYSGSRIGLAALRYDPRAVDAARTVAEMPERKRVHPTRPELGLVEYYAAHRHSWVDRTHLRFSQKRVRLLCREPDGWRAHHNANALQPVRRQHGWEPERLEWMKPSSLRDDWARACDYAELVGSIKLGLDAIHLRGGGGAEVPSFAWGVG